MTISPHPLRILRARDQTIHQTTMARAATAVAAEVADAIVGGDVDPSVTMVNPKSLMMMF
jgi:hypothetical protein